MHRFTFLIFVAMTFVCWGVYGPVLHVGQEKMGADGQLSSLRPFIAVGIAYFLIAVVYPLIVIGRGKEPGNWSVRGFFWSFLAGAVGAIGALGIILAFKFRGSPVYVMPLVFGLAPVVNTLVTMLMARTVRNASLVFYLGVVMVAVGAAGVLWFKPSPHKANSTAAHSQSNDSIPSSDSTTTSGDGDETTGEGDETTGEGKGQSSEVVGSGADDEDRSESDDNSATGTTSNESESAGGNGETRPNNVSNEPDSGGAAAAATTAPTNPNILWVTLCILGTAVCWGSYGPVLHKGQAMMGGSRLRPFLCVGLAYFAIAVIVPYLLLGKFPEPGGWTIDGTAWSLAAGAAGAIGALGIIYAFNYGGKPVYVMPLVFGFAPVVNTLTEMVTKGLYGQVSIWFFASMGLVIVGAVTVLVFAPRGKPAAKK